MEKQEKIQNCISHLTSESDIAKNFVFFGAGAGYSLRVDSHLRLPLGSELRDHLLVQKYRNPSFDSEHRRKQFTEEFGCADTPDLVWSRLIQESGMLSFYYPALSQLFQPDKPVPPAYYMLARWYFSTNNCNGIATTNFDEKIDRAFRSVGNSHNKNLGEGFYIPSVEDDFQFFMGGRIDSKKLVQKLHGTISMPWSIVAGVEGVNEKTKENKYENDNTFIPYRLFKRALSDSMYWVFIGYSFSDNELLDAVVSTYQENPTTLIYVVDPDVKPWQKLVTRLRDVGRSNGQPHRSSNITHLDVRAEDFLSAVLSELSNKKAIDPIELGKTERSALREGPEYIPGCKGRNVSRDYSRGENTFQDVVYGEFSFTESIENDLIDIIDTGELQRLRYIKQLSFVHLKHPSATHDRFTHTLGVSSLADTLFTKLAEKARRGKIPVDYSEFDTPTHLALVLSCLFHDTGHGPLGHTMDLVRARHGITGGHEQDSIAIFKQSTIGQSFADLDKAIGKTAVAKDLILSVLSGDHFLSEVLSNPGVDIDRLDFVLRDGFNTLYSLAPNSGANPYASILSDISSNLDWLLDGAILGSTNERNGIHFGFVDDRKPIVQKIADLYVYLYDTIYYGWQNISAQAMISLAVSELLGSYKYEWMDLVRLTDIELFSALEDFENPKVQEIAYLVKYRRLHEHFLEISYSGSPEISQEEIESLLGFTNESRFQYLVAIKKQKDFSVRFVTTTDMFDQERGVLDNPQILGSSGPKIMFFRWPGQSGIAESHLHPLLERLENLGAENVCVHELA